MNNHEEIWVSPKLQELLDEMSRISNSPVQRYIIETDGPITRVYREGEKNEK